MRESLKIKTYFEKLEKESEHDVSELFKDPMERQHYRFTLWLVNDFINEIIRVEDILEKPLLKKN